MAVCFSFRFFKSSSTCGTKGVADRDGLGVEVNGVPLQSDDLAAAQTVERRHDDAELYRLALGFFKKIVQFLRVVRFADKLGFLRALHPVRRVRVDQAGFVGIVQRLTNVCVAVNDRVGRNTVDIEFVGVVILDMPWREIDQLQLRKVLVEVGNHLAVDGLPVGGKGRFFHARPHHFDPAGKIAGEQERRVNRRFPCAQTFDRVETFAFLHSCFLQKFFRFLFVAFDRQTGGDLLRFSLAVFIGKAGR